MEFPVLETLLHQPSWVLLFLSLGAFSVLRLSLSVLRRLFIFLRPSKNLLDYGKWAVVTGPTDGIGKAYAFLLARRGLNVVLVGRNPDKLSLVSGEIRAEAPGVELRTVVVDFAADLSDGIRDLEDAMKDIDVGILVNNAGLMQTGLLYLHEIEEEMWGNMIKVNMVAPTVVTAAVLPCMLRRRLGAIINLGSGSTTIAAFPFFSVYSSTKRYIVNLSKSLHAEYKHEGIHVQCQIPWLVATKMVPMTRPSFFVPTSSQYAHSALRLIGNGSECIPYWIHALQIFLLRCPPDFIVNYLIYWGLVKVKDKINI